MKHEIMKLIFDLGEYYSKNLTENQIAMYTDDLCDIPVEELKEAIVRYRKNGDNIFFPLPSQLRAHWVSESRFGR